MKTTVLFLIVCTSFVFCHELRMEEMSVQRRLSDSQTVSFTACGTWQLCYSQGDYYTKETLVLSGKKGSTPTTFSSEYTLYRDKNCSGDVVYHEKVEYSLDSYSVSTGYPYSISSNTTIKSSSVRFTEWNYLGKIVTCEDKSLNTDYQVTDLTCLDEDGNDVYASYKQSQTFTFIFKDTTLGFGGGTDFDHLSDSGCNSISAGLIVVIVIVVIIVILLIVWIVIRSRKTSKKDDDDDDDDDDEKKTEIEMTPQKKEEKKSVEVKPEETKPVVEVKPEEVKPEETKPKEVKPEETKPKEVKTEEVKTEEVKTEEVKPEETKPEEVKTEETKPEETKPVETNPSDTTTQSSA